MVDLTHPRPKDRLRQRKLYGSYRSVFCHGGTTRTMVNGEIRFKYLGLFPRSTTSLLPSSVGNPKLKHMYFKLHSTRPHQAFGMFF